MKPTQSEINRALYGRRQKYGNTKTLGYASKRESEVAAQLHALQRGGQISELEEQVKFVLIPAQKGKIRNEKSLCYVADFRYKDRQGVVHTVDVKGMLTREYVIKRKLLKFIHGIEVEEL